jgi:dTDP-4-amino-4,6-dideoxygalactose transaminase
MPMTTIVRAPTTLAIDGGTPVRQGGTFPTVGSAAGRTIGDEELALVTQVLRSGLLNRNNGKTVLEFERQFAAAYGAAHATASTSGTSAIHVALGALPLEPGDEVITPPSTDFGSIAPILFQNAVPIFADVDPYTLTVLPAQVEALITPRTRAIIAVHLMGRPCDMDALTSIARKHDLYLIEDCAQAHYASYHGRKVGTIGDFGCFSFQQSKQITTGDGGMTITGDAALGTYTDLFADKGWVRAARERGERMISILGLNYRMTELQAAIGLAQLRKLPDVVRRRRENAARLTTALREFAGLQLPEPAPGTEHSYWYYPIRVLAEQAGASAARFTKALRAEGILAGVGYGYPCHLHQVFARHGRHPAPRPGGRRARPANAMGFDVLRHGPALAALNSDGKLAQEYGRGLCPNAERLSDPEQSETILLTWNENFTPADIDDIAEACRKVASWYAAHPTPA